LQADAFRISESIGYGINCGTACSAAASPPLALCRAVVSRFADHRLEESERVRCVRDVKLHSPFHNVSQVVCVLALVTLFKNGSSSILKMLLRSHALVLIMRACIEHPSLLHVVSAAGAILVEHDVSTLNRLFAAGASSRFASILIHSGAIPVLSSILSPALNGKQLDVVHLACKCLLRLASANLPDKCAASAAVALLKCPLISALAVHMIPQPPPSDSPKISKSKCLRLVNVAAVQSPAPVTNAAADAAAVKCPSALLQKESAAATATAAAWAVVQSWFIW
jgi:hypothetical protein